MDNKSHVTQAIGLLSLLVELQTERVAVPEGDVPTTASGSSPSHITDGVLALMNDVSKIAGTIFDVQPVVDSTTVRTLPRVTTTFTYHLIR